MASLTLPAKPIELPSKAAKADAIAAQQLHALRKPVTTSPEARRAGPKPVFDPPQNATKFPGILIRAERRPMKAFAAALIASGILYVVDLHYNEGRYAAVIQRAVTSVLPG